MSLQCFKPGPPQTPVFIDEVKRLLEDLVYGRIRCPLCNWQPTSSSVWACQSFGTPEPFFGGCETIWNTFETKGVCPGCSHQWQWTSCHRCHGWSRHADWYEREPSDHAG